MGTWRGASTAVCLPPAYVALSQRRPTELAGTLNRSASRSSASGASFSNKSSMRRLRSMQAIKVCTYLISTASTQAPLTAHPPLLPLQAINERKQRKLARLEEEATRERGHVHSETATLQHAHAAQHQTGGRSRGGGSRGGKRVRPSQRAKAAQQQRTMQPKASVRTKGKHTCTRGRCCCSVRGGRLTRVLLA